MELLDFTGGPWLLRNGDKISDLTNKGGLFTCDYAFTNIGWDVNGNAFCDGGRISTMDIMENLNNWKYNRKGNRE